MTGNAATNRMRNVSKPPKTLRHRGAVSPNQNHFRANASDHKPNICEVASTDARSSQGGLFHDAAYGPLPSSSE